MKIGRGHSLIPRLSLCPMNTLNRHTHNTRGTLISCFTLAFDCQFYSTYSVQVSTKLNP